MNTQSDDVRELRDYIQKHHPKQMAVWDSITEGEREMHAGLVSKMSVEWACCGFLAYPHERRQA